MNKLPKWVDVVLIPLINLMLALLVSGFVVVLIGENPFRAIGIILKGSLGSPYGLGYTLYYATNFIFTGLAVAVAFHARMFNIGGEGQAMVGGLGAALVCLFVDWPHWIMAFPVAILAAALFGAAWASIPAYLQARRGSHIVITTIMFNFISYALMVYLLVHVLKPTGQMAPESARFMAGAHLPTFHEILAWIGIPYPRSPPANVTFLLALLACVLVWALIWKTRLGYAIRAFGHSETAAVYAGISPFRIIIISMLISGALAGMMAINSVMGEAERLLIDSVQGAGFVGIAAALMGRSHPFGVFLAAVLFGMLYQGGVELEFEMPAVSREMIVVIQALVILFTGALENMVRIPIQKIVARMGWGTS